MTHETPDYSNERPYEFDAEIHRQANPPGSCSCEDCQPDHIVESVIAFRETDHFDTFDAIESAEIESDEVIHFSQMMDRYCDEE